MQYISELAFYGFCVGDSTLLHNPPNASCSTVEGESSRSVQIERAVLSLSLDLRSCCTMLAIPVSKCLSGLGDTSAMLSCMVAQNMCAEELGKADITSLEQYRIAATNIIEPSESGQRCLLQYCQQLRHFAPRFVGLEAQLKLTFTWNDA